MPASKQRQQPKSRAGKRKRQGPPPAPRKERRTFEKDLASKCVKEFLRARLDPWGPFPSLPCNPIGDTTPSYRFRNTLRLPVPNTAINTNGNGFVCFNPYGFASSDRNSVWISAAAAPDGSIDLGVPTNYTGYAGTAAPFTAAQLNASGFNRVKVVGFGVKFYDTTPALYRSGTIATFRNQGNTPMVAQFVGDIMATPSTLITPAAKAPKAWLYNTANKDADDVFMGGALFESLTVISGSNPYLGGFHIQGADQTNFRGYIEVSGIYEYAVATGSLRSAVSSSPVDPNGSKVITAVEHIIDRYPMASQVASGLGNIVKDGILDMSYSAINQWFTGGRLPGLSLLGNGPRVIELD